MSLGVSDDSKGSVTSGIQLRFNRMLKEIIDARERLSDFVDDRNTAFENMEALHMKPKNRRKTVRTNIMIGQAERYMITAEEILNEVKEIQGW